MILLKQWRNNFKKLTDKKYKMWVLVASLSFVSWMDPQKINDHFFGTGYDKPSTKLGRQIEFLANAIWWVHHVTKIIWASATYLQPFLWIFFSDLDQSNMGTNVQNQIEALKQRVDHFIQNLTKLFVLPKKMKDHEQRLQALESTNP